PGHGAHAGRQIARGPTGLVGTGDEMSRGFGVGFAGHLHAVRLQLGAQLGEVLDDAVVDHRELAAGVPVRVGVPVVRGTVRGPPGVPHATVPGELLRLDLTEPLLEVGQRAGRAFHGQAALSVQQRHTRGVVAAVLESSQAVQDDVEGLPMSYITNDAAHPAQRSYLSWS